DNVGVADLPTGQVQLGQVGKCAGELVEIVAQSVTVSERRLAMETRVGQIETAKTSQLNEAGLVLGGQCHVVQCQAGQGGAQFHQRTESGDPGRGDVQRFEPQHVIGDDVQTVVVERGVRDVQ